MPRYSDTVCARMSGAVPRNRFLDWSVSFEKNEQSKLGKSKSHRTPGGTNLLNQVESRCTSTLALRLASFAFRFSYFSLLSS